MSRSIRVTSSASRNRVPAVALLPFAAVASLYGASLVAFVLMSFRRMDASGLIADGEFGMANYARFLSSHQATHTLLDTFFISSYLTLITVILAYPFAYFLVRTGLAALRTSMLGIVMVTFLSGTITRAYAWVVVLGNNGLINRAISALGFERIPLIYNGIGVDIALVHFLLPFCILTLIGVFQTLPRNLDEAAVSLGANRVTAFWRVTVPLTASGIIGASVLTFSVAVGAFLFPLLLGGGKVQMMSNHIYDIIFVTFDIPYAAAAAMVFLVTAVPLIVMLPLLIRQFASKAMRMGY